MPVGIQVHKGVEGLSRQRDAAGRAGLRIAARGIAPRFQLLPVDDLPPQQVQQLPGLRRKGIPPVLERQRFSVADNLVVFNMRQQFLQALDHIGPSAVRDAEPQPGCAALQHGQFRFQLHKAGALGQDVVLHFGELPFPIGTQQGAGLRVRFRLIAPPFPPEQHLQPGGIAVLPDRFRLFGQVGRAPHDAGDRGEADFRRTRFLRLRRFFLVIQQKRPDMFAEQAVAIVVIGAGAARADKAAVLAQPCLRLIRIVSAALHLCAQMPDPILFGLAFIRFDAFHIFFCPRKDRTAQQILDLFHIHPGFPPPASSIG